MEENLVTFAEKSTKVEPDSTDTPQPTVRAVEDKPPLRTVLSEKVEPNPKEIEDPQNAV